MKPYGKEYYKYRKNLRSKTKTARLIAKNADRSLKKRERKYNKQDVGLEAAII